MPLWERYELHAAMQRWLPAILTSAPAEHVDAPLSDAASHFGTTIVRRGGANG